jgi:hypothetical protein
MTLYQEAEGSGKGTSVFAGALLGGSFLGTRKDIMGRGLREWTSFSVGAPLGNLVGGSSTGPCEGCGDGYLSP